MVRVCIIPARLNSTRLPEKPLKMIGSATMIAHCYNRAKLARLVDHVYVATCDKEIFDHIISIGGNAVMTSSLHNRASDRCAEAVESIEGIIGRPVSVVAMYQGDEPMISPDMIDLAIDDALKGTNEYVGNLIAPINSDDDFSNPNTIKVVSSPTGRALYFSRAPIPNRDHGKFGLRPYKQVCVITFTRESLRKFGSLAETPLERAESIDMLRLIENNVVVNLVKVGQETFSVDTSQDLEKVRLMMRDDEYIKYYQCR
jgi:3-deoxy-manno-octulosonate cytidylyltransferase (CMP-KDO synthetase)